MSLVRTPDPGLATWVSLLNHLGTLRGQCGIQMNQPQQHPAQSCHFCRTPTGPITDQCSLLTWSNCGYPRGKAAHPGPACLAVSSHALLARAMQRICTGRSGLASRYGWFIMNISSNSLKRLPILQMGKVNHKDKMIEEIQWQNGKQTSTFPIYFHLQSLVSFLSTT